LAAGHSEALEIQPHPDPNPVPTRQVRPEELCVQSAQTPEAPHVVEAFPGTQVPLEQQLPPAHVPSPAAPHVDVHAPCSHVGVALVQARQAPPDSPQAALETPLTQLVPLQHPPLHWLWPAPHAASQSPMVRLQAWFVGQSSKESQGSSQEPEEFRTRGPDVAAPALPSPAPLVAVTRNQWRPPAGGSTPKP
jgi:hypothetical protein